MAHFNKCAAPFIFLVLALSLMACDLTGRRIFEKPVIFEKPELNVQDVRPATQIPLEWVVLTEDNFEERMKELRASSGDAVVFALTGTGYQTLNTNEADLRRVIQQQRVIIAAYQKYYAATNNGEVNGDGKKSGPPAN